MKKNLLFLISLFLLLNYSNIISQSSNLQKNYSLDEVVITAERFPIKEKLTPKFITVVTSSELQNSGGNNLVDALKRVGGLSYRAFGPLGITHGGMNSELTIRGIKGGELILINGSNIQGAAGYAYDLNLLNLDQIEKVEIVKGASSTLYGSNAMSGVINIITKDHIKNNGLSARVEYGSNEFSNSSLSFRYNKINLGISYQTLGNVDKIEENFTRGYYYNNAPAKKLSWNFNSQIFNNLHINYIGAYNRTNYDRISSKTEKLLKGLNQIQTKNFFDLRYESNSLKAKIFLNNDLLQKDEYSKQSKPDDKNKNYNYGFETNYKFNLSSYAIITGANWIYRAADYNNKYGLKYDTHYSFFTQINKTYFNKLRVLAGFREQFVNGGSQNKNYDIFLPSIGLTYILNNQINIYAYAGKAFRTPTFNNLYYKSDFFEGNSQLKPETGYTYEMGIKYESNLISLRLSGFYMDYKDKIELDRSLAVSRYMNIGKYNSKGIEWNTSISLFDLTGLPLVYSNSGYWANPEAKIKESNYTQMGPKLQMTNELKFYTGKFGAELNSVLIAQRENNLEDYHSVNLSLSYKLWKGLIKFNIDNIWDKQNITTGNFSPESKSRYAYYDLGRQFKIGYEFNL